MSGNGKKVGTNRTGAGFVVSCAIALALGACGVQAQAGEKETVAPVGQPAAQVSPERIQELVRQLGEANFKAREQAQKELTQVGEAARAELEKAAKSKDMEVQQRAITILAEINKSAFQRNSQAVAKDLLWTFPVKAGVCSSPVVQDGVAYVAGSDGKLYAVDAKTGKGIWKFDELPNGETLGEPVVGEGMVFVSSPGKALYALDAAKGKSAWKFEYPAPAQPQAIQGQKAPVGVAVARPMIARVGGFPMRAGGAAAVSDGMVFISGIDGTKLYGLDAKQGQKQWEADVAGMCSGRPVAADGVVCQGCADGTLLALDAKTGKELWKSNLSQACAGLAIRGGSVYCLTDGKLQALEAKTGKDLWKCDLPGGVQNAGNVKLAMAIALNNRRLMLGQGAEDALTVTDGAAYAVCGQELVAVDTKDGKKKWEYKLDLKGEGGADQNEEGNAGEGVMIFNGGAGGAQVQVQMVVANGRVVTSSGAGVGGVSAAIGKDTAYVGASTGLHGIDLKTGLRVWRLATPGPVTGRPVLLDGVLYFGTSPQPQAQGEDNAGKDKLSPGLHALRVKE